MITASGKSRTITAITLALAVGQTADTSGASAPVTAPGHR